MSNCSIFGATAYTSIVSKNGIMTSDQEKSLHASESSRARELLSLQNITHPVRWADENLENAYNRRRKTSKRGAKSDFQRVNVSDDA